MNGTNSTQISAWFRLMGLAFVLTLGTINVATSQVSCACKGTLNVSVDEECNATITAEQVLADGSTCGGTSTAVVTLMKTPTTGQIVTGTNSVNFDARLYVGKAIYAKVATADGRNSCWSTINVEDKMKPRWESDEPLVMVVSQCAPLEVAAPTALDNCKTARVYQVGEDVVINNCDNAAGFAGVDTIKMIRRLYRAVDEYGNISNTDCVVDIYIRAFSRNQVIGITNRELNCEDPYARIPVGQPFAGNPSPTNIGLALGTGVPSQTPWVASTRGAGTADLNPANGNLRLTGGTDAGVSSGMGAQVCITANGSGNIAFNWSAIMQGSTPPTGNFNGDHAQWNLNGGSWTNLTVAGPGDVMQTGSPSVPVVADDVFCLRVRTNNNARWTELMVSNITGPVPTSIALNPNTTHCNIVTSFADMELPIHKCTKKIMRTWKIIDWTCNTRIMELVQMIEIVDNKGPRITGLKNDYASTHGHACEAMYKIQKPTLTDNCSNVDQLKYTVNVKNSDGEFVAQVSDIKLSDPDRFIRLPLGCDTLIYTAFDECHNQTRDTILLFVEDNTPPVSVCRQNTVVGLTTGGKAWVPATSFNEGSYDECDLAKVLVRRMDNTNCQPCKVPTIEGFTYLGEYQRTGEAAPHHYYASKHRANPKTAMKTAAAVGGYLTTINDAPEGAWVHGKVKEWRLGLDYLIGLRDEKNKGTYSWIGGQPDVYRNWGTNEPGNKNLLDGVDSTWVTVRDAVGGMDGRWFTQAVENCAQSEWIYVVEIDNVCNAFGDYVEFCCADIAPTPQVVVMRAIDKAGNWNECMVNATIQDKQPLLISCPPHETVLCSDLFDLSLVGLSNRFGSATLFGNCTNGEIEETFTHTLNSCRIGTITRTFTARRGNEAPVVCTQLIHVNADPATLAIEWPRDTTFVGCTDPNSPALSPNVLGRPDIIGSSSCSLAGADYRDQVFYFNQGGSEACFKIIRHWTVIDWCKYTESSSGGRTYYEETHTQVIKVNDIVRPVILSSCAPKEVCTYDATCQSGYIELIASANDNCTNDLRYSYQIDLNNDKSFERLSNGSLDPRYSKLGQQSTGVGNTFVNTIDASGTYPVGTHRIVWSFEDRCGNVTQCEQLFTIANCKAPTPYCLNGLATSLMPMDTNGDGTPDTGMVEIWAKDWDAGSVHPCGYEVLHSFAPITLDANGRPVLSMVRQFTCADRPRVDLNIYVGVITPMGTLIQDFCATFITIQDNFNVCPPLPPGRFVIEGTVATEELLPISNTYVSLPGTEMDAMTDVDGRFMFNDLVDNANYLVKASKNDDILNGVSTLDLVTIQRHILGLAEITSPYKLIASDINNDQRLTASDLSELRRLILGVSDKFTNNESWRFVDKTFTFTNAAEAYAESIPEMCEISVLNEDKVIDFVAIKVGDVNGSAISNGRSAIVEPRSKNVLELTTDNLQFENGQSIEVPFVLSEDTYLGGFQFTLNFDSEMYNLVSVNGVLAGMTDNNFGFNRLAEGVLTVSYGHDNGLDLRKGQEIFTVTLQAKSDGSLANSLWVNSLITRAEAYTSDLKVMNVNFKVNQRTNGEIVLYQNTPNPFRGTTSVGFELPESSSAKVTIYDVTGKAVKVIEGTFTKGHNTIELERGELGSAGVFYYTLEVADFKATKKMVVID